MTTPRSLTRTAAWLLAAAVVAGTLATPATSHARRRLTLVEDGRGLLHSYSATAGLILNQSGDFNLWSRGHKVGMQAYGFRYYERNGFITGTIFAIMRMLSAAAAASGPKSYESWTEGSYRYTRTTYYSQAEKNAMSRAASNDAARAFTRPGQSFDLEIYSRNLGGDSSGYKVTMMAGGVKVSGRGQRARGMVDFGIGFGSVDSAAHKDGKYLVTHWAYFGVPIRLTYAVGPVNIYGLWEWNWLGHTRGSDTTGSSRGANTTEADVAGMPLRIGLNTTLFRRLYVEAAASTPSLTSGVFGFVASAGARF